MNGLSKDDVLRMVREIADKDKVDPLHNDMVTLTVDELGRLLAAEREKVAQLCEQMGAEGYGTLFIAAAIRARGNDAA